MGYQDTLNIKDKDLDRDIFRIMPIHRLLEMFQTKLLTLVPPIKWDDPFENLLLNGTAKTSDGEVADFGSIRDSVYGQCWTLHKETDAMWRIYSADKQGAKVKTTIRKLLKALQQQSGDFAQVHCFIGEVEYHTQKDLIKKLKNIDVLNTSGSGVAESLIYKREEFKHEREVRLIYTDGSGPVHQFEIDPCDLFDEIVFDPRINEHLFEAYKAALKNKGYSNSIRQSVMYQPPKGLQISI
ncbi:DUF2971 domain-containing protein [uncultured Marinobacter sp.]|uniref:DUF2971 domain-containing protein n=1 Tax=uncultured Marinobacter sp. TaxID=187379 RepID=UPI0025EC9020|nr:DUF2971 domain-containing protein [uncultured Marinobacter sp.]